VLWSVLTDAYCLTESEIDVCFDLIKKTLECICDSVQQPGQQVSLANNPPFELLSEMLLSSKAQEELRQVICKREAYLCAESPASIYARVYTFSLNQLALQAAKTMLDSGFTSFCKDSAQMLFKLALTSEE